MSRGNTLVGFRIPDSELNSLDNLCRATGYSRGDVLRAGLRLAAGRYKEKGFLMLTPSDTIDQLLGAIAALCDEPPAADADDGDLDEWLDAES